MWCDSEIERKHLPVSFTDFINIFPLAVQMLNPPFVGKCSISQIMPKIHDYLEYSQIPLCVMNNSNSDSELEKRFFRKFRNFLAPGVQVRKSRISRVKTNFWKIVVNLTIFGKSTIFQSPLKSVDESWHRRYKNFETFNHSIFTP